MKQHPPPKDLDPAARAVWKVAQNQLREQGSWRRVDTELLAVYCRNMALARESRACAAAKPFVAGSKGQPVAHPGLKVAAEAEAAALRSATALLLTPESRKRHGVGAETVEDELDKILAIG